MSRMIWQALKPLLMGKILYTPHTSATQKIIHEVKHHAMFFSHYWLQELVEPVLTCACGVFRWTGPSRSWVCSGILEECGKRWDRKCGTSWRTVHRWTLSGSAVIAHCHWTDHMPLQRFYSVSSNWSIVCCNRPYWRTTSPPASSTLSCLKQTGLLQICPTSCRRRWLTDDRPAALSHGGRFLTRLTRPSWASPASWRFVHTTHIIQTCVWKR